MEPCGFGLTAASPVVIQSAALRRLTATRAAAGQLAVPVVLATGSLLVLDERFSARLGLAGILMLGGMEFAALRPNRR